MVDQAIEATGASALRMYCTVVGVGVACAVAIVSVHEVTGPRIAQNRLVYRSEAILSVLPDASQYVAYCWDERGRFAQPNSSVDAGEQVFAGFDSTGRLVGVAMEAEGMGYQDVIRVLYGYSFDQQAIIGMRVLQSRETPGLGDSIEKDRQFTSNFAQLDVRLNASGDALAHPIEFVAAGTKRELWQIDGISGATISSRAVAEMLRRSTSEWIPRVHGHLVSFQLPEPSDGVDLDDE